MFKYSPIPPPHLSPGVNAASAVAVVCVGEAPPLHLEGLQCADDGGVAQEHQESDRGQYCKT